MSLDLAGDISTLVLITAWCCQPLPEMTLTQSYVAIWRHYSPQWVNCLSAGPVYIRDSHLVITVPADGLAPRGARPSAGTAMATQLHTFSTKYHSLEVMLRYLSWPDDVIQNGRRDPEKSHGTSSVKSLSSCASLYTDPIYTWGHDTWTSSHFQVLSVGHRLWLDYILLRTRLVMFIIALWEHILIKYAGSWMLVILANNRPMS